MVTKMYQFHNAPHILPILENFVLRLSEHDDVIETQTKRFVPPKFLANSVPALNQNLTWANYGVYLTTGVMNSFLTKLKIHFPRDGHRQATNGRTMERSQN